MSVHLDPLSRMAWETLQRTAEATERVQNRQIGLLTTQRDIIDEQLTEATFKRDEAIRDQQTAREMLNA